MNKNCLLTLVFIMIIGTISPSYAAKINGITILTPSDLASFSGAISGTTITGDSFSSRQSASLAGSISLYEISGNGTNYLKLVSPDSLANTYSFLLPGGTPTAGQAIVASAPSAGVITLSYSDLSSGSIGGSTGSTDNRILRADGTEGATIQGSAASIDDSGNAIFTSISTSNVDGSNKETFFNNTSATPTGSTNELYFETNLFKINQNGTEYSSVIAPTAGQITFSGPSAPRIVTITDSAQTLLNSTASGIQTFLTTPSSTNLFAAITDETGSGSGALSVFSINPTLTGLTNNRVNAADGSADASVLSGELGIFNGSDTFRGIFLNYTNSNHTGTGNTVALIDTAAITGDANSNLFGLRIGTLTGTTGASGEVEDAILIGSGWDADIAKTGGILTIGGSGSTNNEKLTLDFETNSNIIGLSSASGATKIDAGSLALATTGMITGGIASVGSFASPTTSSGTYSLTDVNCYGSVIFYNDTDTLALPSAVAGMNVCIYVTGTNLTTIDPNSSDIIVRDGAVQSGGVSITIAGIVGNYVTLYADAANHWITLGFKGTLAQGS